jgi:hypothetical protein
MSIDELRAAIEAQADARVRVDDATFASYLTAKAILQLGAARLPSQQPRRSQVMDISEQDAGSAISDVLYSGGGWSYVLRTRWQLIDGLWRGTSAEVVEGTVKAAWWRRLLRRISRPSESAPPRRDLS